MKSHKALRIFARTTPFRTGEGLPMSNAAS